jgi:hypothetical protein
MRGVIFTIREEEAGGFFDLRFRLLGMTAARLGNTEQFGLQSD